jgi:hypothetical protein
VFVFVQQTKTFGGADLIQFSFQSILRLIRVVTLIQVFNLAMGYLVWAAYDFSISGWTIAALSVGATFLMLAIKKAQENNENQSSTN